MDPPLTERGSEQARLAALNFNQQFPDGSHNLLFIFTSPLHRAFKTALEFAKVLNLPLVVVAGLSECSAWAHK